jgi:prepilin-type N-terminal cleavage/methylation domain-containing protein
MRSITRTRSDGRRPGRDPSAAAGFTLIEVLVALAIASGALVLILCATTTSLRRGARARLEARLERASESKLSEWLAGAERYAQGSLAGFDGHRWEVQDHAELLAPIRTLRRVTLTVRGPDGERVLEWTRLVQGKEGLR